MAANAAVLQAPPYKLPPCGRVGLEAPNPRLRLLWAKMTHHFYLPASDLTGERGRGKAQPPSSLMVGAPATSFPPRKNPERSAERRWCIACLTYLNLPFLFPKRVPPSAPTCHDASYVTGLASFMLLNNAFSICTECFLQS